MEPERKIEKWLKAYAKKRRTQAGEPFKLHPATRQLLQSEVARDKPKPADEDESVSLWEVIRQQWAILLSFAACIFLVGMIFFHSASEANKRAELAKVSGTKEMAAAASAPTPTSSAPPPAPLEAQKDVDLAGKGLADKESNQPLLAEDDRKAYSQRDIVLATNGIKSPDTAMTITPSAAPGLSQSITASPLEVSPAKPAAPPLAVAGEDYTVAPRAESSVSVSNSLNSVHAGPTTTPPLVASAAPSGSFSIETPGAQSLETIPAAAPPVEMPAPEQNEVTFRERLKSESNLGTVASRQQGEFQNAFKNSVVPLPNAPVLANFQVQQNGNAIRLVDQDGSVYDGSLQSANPLAKKTDEADLDASRRAMQNAVTVVAGLPSQQITAAQDALQVAQTYFFHVYGTNRTVKQTVAFTGNLMVNVVSTNSTKLAYELADHSVATGGGGFGGGGGGSAVGGTFGLTKSETTNQLAQLPWADLRITGTAVVNRTNRIEIDAAPVAPNRP